MKITEIGERESDRMMGIFIEATVEEIRAVVHLFGEEVAIQKATDDARTAPSSETGAAAR